MSTIDNIQGRKVLIDNEGREVTKREETTRERINGPHHDAKWARRLLGTDVSQAAFRRRRILSLASSPSS